MAKPWRCSTCKKKFGTVEGCRRHIIDYHPLKGGSAEPYDPPADDFDSEAANYIKQRYGVEI